MIILIYDLSIKHPLSKPQLTHAFYDIICFYNTKNI